MQCANHQHCANSYCVIITYYYYHYSEIRHGDRPHNYVSNAIFGFAVSPGLTNILSIEKRIIILETPCSSMPYILQVPAPPLPAEVPAPPLPAEVPAPLLPAPLLPAEVPAPLLPAEVPAPLLPAETSIYFMILAAGGNWSITSHVYSLNH